jgi:hypothetical protein
MARSDRSATLLAAMIIATIYVIMLIGLTRSTYFIGGDALQRFSRRSAGLLPMTRSPPPPAGSSVCVPPELQAAISRECPDAAVNWQKLRQMLSR